MTHVPLLRSEVDEEGPELAEARRLQRPQGRQESNEAQRPRHRHICPREQRSPRLRRGRHVLAAQMRGATESWVSNRSRSADARFCSTTDLAHLACEGQEQLHGPEQVLPNHCGQLREAQDGRALFSEYFPGVAALCS